MSGKLTFLPYLRRGLARAISTPDQGILQSGPMLTAIIEVAGQPATATVRLLGPESVDGVAEAQILRAEPRPDSTDVETNYFPFVEVASPDLPWMLTPAGARDGRLRPWLVLVVVREQEGVTLAAAPEAPLPVLHTPIAELPDLGESWAWVHVQSRVGLDGLEPALADASGDVVGRLTCPRKLVPDSAWMACLVPAFDAGRLAGLGQPVARGATLDPAWAPAADGDEIDLPVYYSWRFSTGAAGDFESVCRRLKPDRGAADLGVHAMDVGAPGLLTPVPREVLVDMQGPLQSPGAASRPWNPEDQAIFRRQVARLLDTAVARPADDPGGPDPVVAPPFYAAGPSGAGGVPAGGWLPELNLDPVLRAAAGLGVAVVRADQEALVAAAWDQAADAQDATTVLNRGRLAAEVAHSLARRARDLADPDLLQLTAPMHAFLRSGGTTIRATLASSEVPAGMFCGAYLRQTRPGTALARRWSAPGAEDSGRLGADHAAITLRATGPHADPGDLAAVHFADRALPDGAEFADASLTDPPSPALIAEPSSALTAGVKALLHLSVDPVPARPRRAARPAPRAQPQTPLVTADVSGIADTVRGALAPAAAVRAAVVDRVPALGDLPADEPLPTTLLLAPVFEDPLAEDLARLGAGWMLPGAERIARNRVRLVQANPTFVGAFLVGANEELRRELLWRGYPVIPGATFFHRFWAYVGDPRPVDIGELTAWKRRLSIADNIARDTDGQVTAATVIVVRGDLVRRYPSAHYFLQAAVTSPDGLRPDDDAPAVEPVFAGALGPETVFFGFELEVRVVRGTPGYFLAIEEQAGAPRLGLDVARPRDFKTLPATWNDASWGHLVHNQEELDALTHARADSSRLVEMGALDGITWGQSSSHLARACWRRPFRMYIHADALI